MEESSGAHPSSARASVSKRETQAAEFLSEFPHFDGSGVTVGILDTGVSPKTPGLSKGKVVDFIDCTGGGDVKMVEVDLDEAKTGTIVGLSGRKMRLPIEWMTGVTSVRKGIFVFTNVMPPSLRCRYLKTRKEDRWLAEVKDVLRTLHLTREQHAQNSAEYEDVSEQMKVLNQLRSKDDDPGMICDCIAWLSADCVWKSVIDTSEEGDLAQCTRMGDYGRSGDIGTFSALDMCTYSLKIESDNVCVVCDSGAHGSHVATICAGLFENAAGAGADQPWSDEHGVAPGARILSCKIGDAKLNSMETGIGLARALGHCIDRKVDIINYSYGESSVFVAPDCKLQSLLSRAVNEHGIVFVSSCGNDGPALSTMGSPGGTFSDVIGIGAFLSSEMASSMYSTFRETPPMAYDFSSRGPTKDGFLGACVTAPGGAVAGVPHWRLSCVQLMNGTSMSSPNAAGCIALLVSALKASKITYTPNSIKRALVNTAKCRRADDDDDDDDEDRFANGAGLVQILNALKFIRQMPSDLNDVCLDTTVEPLSRADAFQPTIPTPARGIYLRHPDQSERFIRYQVTLKPRFTSSNTTFESQKEQIWLSKTLSIKPTEPSWIRCTDRIKLVNDLKRFEVEIDTSELPANTGDVHFAEIHFEVADEPRYGVLHTLPVTVIRPVRITELRTDLFSVKAMRVGQVFRKFVAAPSSVSSLTVRISPAEEEEEGGGAGGQYMLHMVYLHPNRASSSTRLRTHFELSPKNHDPFEAELAIDAPNSVVEICIAKCWRFGKDAGGVRCQVIASTLRAAQSLYNFQSSLPCMEVEILTGDCNKNAWGVGGGSYFISFNNGGALSLNEPSRPVKLSVEWRELVLKLSPTKSKISPGALLVGFKNPDNCIYQLCLEYNLNITKTKANVKLILPVLGNYLYESSFLSQKCSIYDSVKNCVFETDALCKQSAQLTKGEHTIKLVLVHADVEVLGTFKSLCMHAHISLQSMDVKLPEGEFYTTPMDAVQNCKSSNVFNVGGISHICVYLKKIPDEKLESIAPVGSHINGRLLAKTAASRTSMKLAFINYIVVSKLCEKKRGTSPAPDQSNVHAIETYRISMLKKTGDVNLIPDSEINTNSKLLTALLDYQQNCLEKDSNEPNDVNECFSKILNLSNQVINLLDNDALRLSILALPRDNPAETKKITDDKNRLIKALIAKGVALIGVKDVAFIPGQDYDNMENMDEIYSKLRIYAENLDSNKMTCKFIGQYHCIKGHFGQALSAFNNCEESKTVCEWIRAIYARLGWVNVEKMYSATIIKRFIADKY